MTIAQNRSGWQNAHSAAVASLSIVFSSNRVSRPWPFLVADATTGATTQAKRGGATGGAAAARIVPPVGNTGGTYLRGELHV